MTALTKDRLTRRVEGDVTVIPVKGAAKIFAGSIVAADASGFALPGGVAGGVRARGRAERQADNSLGSNGALSVEVRSGSFLFANGAGVDQITAADILADCFVIDDQTVGKTIGDGKRVKAGRILGIDETGQILVRLGGGSDVRKAFVPLLIDDLRGAQAKVYRIAAPVAGAVTGIFSTLDAALATGDATLTSKIGATAITGGVATITQAGSAPGDYDTAAPTAANVVAQGDILSITVGGANTAQVAARVLVEISY